jgi:hypothetical protein
MAGIHQTTPQMQTRSTHRFAETKTSIHKLQQGYKHKHTQTLLRKGDTASYTRRTFAQRGSRHKVDGHPHNCDKHVTHHSLMTRGNLCERARRERCSNCCVVSMSTILTRGNNRNHRCVQLRATPDSGKTLAPSFADALHAEQRLHPR